MLVESIIYVTEAKQWWEVWISPAVTIIGLIVTYILTTKTIQKEVENKKTNISLDELAKVPHNLLLLMEDMLKGTPGFLDEFINIVAKIFAYGSKEAIKIAANMQEYNYLYNGKEHFNPFRLMAYFIILTCQIKYDLTGQKINPEYWYKIKITDYQDKKAIFISANNAIVDELELDSFLIIK